MSQLKKTTVMESTNTDNIQLWVGRLTVDFCEDEEVDTPIKTKGLKYCSTYMSQIKMTNFTQPKINFAYFFLLQ